VHGIGSSHGVGINGFGELNLLLRNLSTGRPALEILARYGELDAGPGVDRYNRPVAAEGEAAAAVEDRFPGEGPLLALGADVDDPGSHPGRIGVGMERLEAGDDAEPAEAGDIVRGDVFRVPERSTLARLSEPLTK